MPDPLPLLTDASTSGPAPTLLPDDGPDAAVAALLEEGVAPHDAAAEHPASSLAWAVLAEHAERADRAGSTVEAYAYARAGYHRGLDALRRAGWRGAGPVPWRHGPNRGFLRALAALGRGAAAIGEDEEVRRIDAFLRDCDAAALEEITRHGPGPAAS